MPSSHFSDKPFLFLTSFRFIEPEKQLLNHLCSLKMKLLSILLHRQVLSAVTPVRNLVRMMCLADRGGAQVLMLILFNVLVLFAGHNTTQVQYSEVFLAPGIVGKETIKML